MTEGRYLSSRLAGFEQLSPKAFALALIGKGEGIEPLYFPVFVRQHALGHVFQFITAFDHLGVLFSECRQFSLQLCVEYPYRYFFFGGCIVSILTVFLLRLDTGFLPAVQFRRIDSVGIPDLLRY